MSSYSSRLDAEIDSTPNDEGAFVDSLLRTQNNAANDTRRTTIPVGTTTTGTTLSASHVFSGFSIRDDYYLSLVDWKGGLFAIGEGQNLTILDEAGMRRVTLQVLSHKPPPHHRRPEEITAVTVSNDGALVAVGTSMSSVLIIDPTAQKLRLHTNVNCGRIPAIAFNPQGTCLSIGTRQGALFNVSVPALLEAAEHAPRHTITPRALLHTPGLTLSVGRGHRAEVCGLQWSVDGRFLASGGNDSMVYVWPDPSSSVDTVPAPPAAPMALHGHKAAVKAFAWSSSTPHFLATGGGSSDGCLRVWDCRTGTMLVEVATRSQLCAIAWPRPDSLAVGHGFSSNCITTWRWPPLSGPKGIRQVGVIGDHEGRVLYLGTDGHQLASAGADGTVKIWPAFGGSRQPRTLVPDSLPLMIHGGAPSDGQAPGALNQLLTVAFPSGIRLNPYHDGVCVI